MVSDQADIPTITTSQMVEVDRAMIENYQISLTQMMENAGRNLAHLARRRFLDNDPRGKRVVVLSGTGGNGGGALVAARRLANYGAKLLVITSRSADAFQGIPRRQLEILRRMAVLIHTADVLESGQWDCDLILDGIIGYSLRGAARGDAARMIRWANAQSAPILSLDIPSGVDGTKGNVYEPAVTATATMTLALPKTGLLVENAATAVGELFLADISVPPALYAAPGIDLEVGHIFAQDDIIRMR